MTQRHSEGIQLAFPQQAQYLGHAGAALFICRATH
jgi:hypothetical protein